MVLLRTIFDEETKIFRMYEWEDGDEGGKDDGGELHDGFRSSLRGYEGSMRSRVVYVPGVLKLGVEPTSLYIAPRSRNHRVRTYKQNDPDMRPKTKSHGMIESLDGDVKSKHIPGFNRVLVFAPSPRPRRVFSMSREP